MSRKKVYSTKLYIRFLTFMVFFVFTRYFRVKKKLPVEVRKLKPPFLILSNHVGYWDPFIVGHPLPYFTHFVSSDAAFRNTLLRFFLTRLGTIPKKKNMRDTKVIRDIKAVMDQGENVGIFPEAVRNWAGSSFAMDPSIIKLIRFLDVPVVVATLKGMNLFNPRWSKKLRRTRLEVEYKLLFQPESYATLGEDDLYRQLSDAIRYDEVDHQRKFMHKIYSNKRAEHINHALYVCPECHAIDSFRANKNAFSCNECGYDIHIDSYGFFQRISAGKLYFDNIRDWYNWEEKFLSDYVSEKYSENFKGVLFEDIDSKIYHALTDGNLDFIGIADVQLSIDKIELIFKDRPQKLVFNFHDLQTINPQVHERLELFYNHEVYRFVGGRDGVSGLKWEVAANAIWRKMGHNHKLSPYINPT